jgi:hypothetical protein
VQQWFLIILSPVGDRRKTCRVLHRINGFTGVLLQLHIWNNDFKTSTNQLTASQLRVNVSHITNSSESESESYVMTNGQLANLSWNKEPIWGLRTNFCYCKAVEGFERTGLSFTIASGPRQRSHSRVRVPWDAWPYFTVSDSRLPFLSPPRTRRATVAVFDPASTWD